MERIENENITNNSEISLDDISKNKTNIEVPLTKQDSVENVSILEAKENISADNNLIKLVVNSSTDDLTNNKSAAKENISADNNLIKLVVNSSTDDLTNNKSAAKENISADNNLIKLVVNSSTDDLTNNKSAAKENISADNNLIKLVVNSSTDDLTNNKSAAKENISADNNLIKLVVNSSTDDLTNNKSAAKENISADDLTKNTSEVKKTLEKVFSYRHTTTLTDNYDFFVNKLMYYMSVCNDLIKNEEENIKLNKRECNEKDFLYFKDRFNIILSKFFIYYVLDSKFSFIDFIEYIDEFSDKWNKNILMNISILNNLDLYKIYNAYKECLNNKKENIIANISDMLKNTKKIIYKLSPISAKEDMIYVFKNENLIKYDYILKNENNMGKDNYNKYIETKDDKFMSRRSLENCILDYIYSSTGIFNNNEINDIISFETSKKDGVEVIKTFKTKEDLIYSLIKCCTLISKYFGEKEDNKYFNSKYSDFYINLDYLMYRISVDVDFNFIHYFISMNGIGKSKWIKDLFGDRSFKTRVTNILETKKSINPKVYKSFIKAISEYDFILESIRHYNSPNETNKEIEEKEKKNFITREPNGKAVYTIDLDKINKIVEKFKVKLSAREYNHFKTFLANMQVQTDKSISIRFLNECVKNIYMIVIDNYFNENKK